jgi:hypothetical protein
MFRVDYWSLDPEEAPEEREVVHEERVFWCERDKMERSTYGYADAYQVCEYQGGRREGHGECGFRTKLVVK